MKNTHEAAEAATLSRHTGGVEGSDYYAATLSIREVAVSSSSPSPADSNNEISQSGGLGTEHFSIWLKESGTKAPRFVTAWVDEPWPEFIPGVHYDIRQPSRLQGLCSPRKQNEDRQR